MDAGSAEDPPPRPTVLVVTDRPALRNELRACLQGAFQLSIEASEGPTAVQETLASVRRGPPTVALVDLDMAHGVGETVLAALSEQHPEVLRVALVRGDDPESTRRAILAGARDYVVKPLCPDQALEVLNRVVRLRRERTQAVKTSNRPGAGIWAFANAAGGSGQTTLVLSIASELAAFGAKVVVVDLDLIFGDTTFYLGLAPGALNLSSLLANDEPLDPAVLQGHLVHHASGVQVLAEPPSPSDAYALPAQDVQAAVMALSQVADFVLLDLPTGLRDEHLPYLDPATFVFAVADSSPTGLKNLRRLTSLLLEANFSPNRIRPLLTRCDPDEVDLGRFRKNLGKLDLKLAATFPPDPEAARRALEAAEPVARIAPRSPFSLAVREFLAPALAGGRPVPERTLAQRLLDRLLG